MPTASGQPFYSEDPSSIDWRGVALPVVRSKGGYFASKKIDQLILSSILITIGTPRGQRPMLPEFGGGVFEQVFEQGPDAATAVDDAIRRQVPRWDPRVGVLYSETKLDGDHLEVFVVFSVAGQDTRFERRLVLSRGTPIGGL